MSRDPWSASPSTRPRTDACPGWAALTYYYRDVLRTPKESSYARDGTAAHVCLEARIKGEPAPEEAKSVLLDSETVERHSMAIEFAVGHIHKLIKRAQKKHKDVTWSTERKVSIFPDLLYAGTADFTLMYDNTLHVVDYKHGAGVAVPASSTQLVDYLIGAELSSGKRGQIKRYLATVIQPRHPRKKERAETVEYDAKDFAALVKQQYDRARLSFTALRVTQMSDTPPAAGLVVRGDHCGWCPAKPACPRWRGPISAAVAAYDRDMAKGGAGHPTRTGAALEQLLVDAHGIKRYLEDVRALVEIYYQRNEGNGLLHFATGATRTFFNNDAQEKLNRLRKKKKLKKKTYNALFRRELVTLNVARQLLPPAVLEDITHKKQDKASLVPKGPSTQTAQLEANRIFQRHGERQEEG